VVSSWNGHDYGYGWWSQRLAGERVWFAWGYGGQYVFVVPRLDLVVAVTSSLANRPPGSDGHNTRILRLLGEKIIPAARGPERDDPWPPLPQPVIGW
jgi:CubicO group peptidase (beta-lactamase class C family)